MSDEPVPYIEGEPAPSPRHIRAILKHQDGSPDQDVWIDPETLNHGPLRHADIDELLPMIRWQWRHLGKYASWCRSFEDWELGFMRDSNPGSEVAVFMRAAYAFVEFANANPKVDPAMIFGAVMNLINGRPDAIEPKSVADKLTALLEGAPQAFADPGNFTEDGRFKPGPSHLR